MSIQMLAAATRWVISRLKPAVFAGLAAASFPMVVAAEDAPGCAALREPKPAAGLLLTGSGTHEEKLVLYCEVDAAAAISYRLTLSQPRSGGEETLATETGSCAGLCSVRVGSAVPATAPAQDLLVTVDF